MASKFFRERKAEKWVMSTFLFEKIKQDQSKGNHGVKGMVNPATAFVTVLRTAGLLRAGIVRVS
jgi:hypothetical protein